MYMYLFPSGSADVPDPVVFHVGCGSAPVQQPHDHWWNLLQLRSRSDNTQLHTGNITYFMAGKGIPSPDME